jgi:hypothetical protein
MSDNQFPVAKESAWEDITSGLFYYVLTAQLASQFPLNCQTQLIGYNNTSMTISREHVLNSVTLHMQVSIDSFIHPLKSLLL